MTQLEQELREAKFRCWRSLNLLGGSWFARRCASDLHRFFIEELQYLLKEIDVISGLVINAKCSIREMDDIKSLLFESSARNMGRPQPRQLIQLIHQDVAVSEQLMKVHKAKNETMNRLSRRLENFNSKVNALIIQRHHISNGRWLMNIFFPTISDLPDQLDVQLIEELYENGRPCCMWGNVIDIPQTVDE